MLIYPVPTILFNLYSFSLLQDSLLKQLTNWHHNTKMYSTVNPTLFQISFQVCLYPRFEGRGMLTTVYYVRT